MRRVAIAVVAVLVGVGVSAVTSATPAVAAGSIAKVQDSATATATAGSVTASYSPATTAGNLLVATVAYAGVTPGFSAPSGWVRAVSKASTLGETEIWYYPGNPGAITSVSFTFTAGVAAALELSEWSGADAVSPLDKTGSTSTAATTSVTVSTSASTVAAGELAVTSYSQSFTSTTSGEVYTPASGWTNLGSGAISTLAGKTSDHRLGLAAGTISELETSSKSGRWAAAIATFKVACTGGSLTLTSPSSLDFGSTVLTGVDQTVTASASLTASDMTGGASGWNLQATSTTFTNAGGKTLPTTATAFTGASASAAAGTCSLPANSIVYPQTLPAGATAPTAIKVFNAASATGAGPSTVVLAASLVVPAKAYAGTYSATWTFTISSGP
jgi:hypothetical protein